MAARRRRRAALAARGRRHGAALVEAQQLERRSSSPARCARRPCSVGLVSPRSTWESIGALTPQRSARSRNERSMRLAQRAHTGADAADGGLDRMGGYRHTIVRYRIRAHPLRPSRPRWSIAPRGFTYRLRKDEVATLVPGPSPRSSYAGTMGKQLRSRPDALVLGGGGTLGEAWMRGLLSGAESARGLDFRPCEYFVGTSAGSIVAATLAAGRRPEAGDRAGGAWAAGERRSPRRRRRSARRPGPGAGRPRRRSPRWR